MFKYVRIAVTALCLAACMLLVALWVRSYWWSDECTLASRLMIRSAPGRVHYHALFDPYSFTQDWNYSCWPISDGASKLELAKDNLFRFARHSITTPGVVPYWFLILPPAALSVVLWIRQLKWRFSLRTLFIATTLVAAGLGSIIALNR
jgi:hypothetical protein